jgi:hypothetical protein
MCPTSTILHSDRTSANPCPAAEIGVACAFNCERGFHPKGPCLNRLCFGECTCSANCVSLCRCTGVSRGWQALTGSVQGSSHDWNGVIKVTDSQLI